MPRKAAPGRAMRAFSRFRGGGSVLWLLGLCLFCYLLAPMLSFLGFLPWSQIPAMLSDPNAQEALTTSLISASCSTLFIALFGIPLGYVLARFNFPGKTLVSLLLYVPLVFPPVVSGIILLLLYGPYGIIGGPLAARGWEIDDTLVGVIIAQAFVSAPFLVVAARSSFESIDPNLEKVAMTLGQKRWGLFWRVSLPLAWRGILAGLILAWMRALGEFGATVVMAYHPYTLPVYVYVQLSGSGVASALPLALLSLGVSILVMGLVVLIERRSQRIFQGLPRWLTLPTQKQER
ncbi:MAG TPA: ABC transporter permease [Ktedonobacteraceae bacterium]|nr:ABC transporter permease [Ktedonobacteraceae bacterium]